jgi:hypothetical protein
MTPETLVRRRDRPAARRLLPALIGLIVAVTGCTLPTGGRDTDEIEISGAPIVRLAPQLNNQSYREGVDVQILAAVSNAGEDIASVQVSVDNTVIETLENPNTSGAPTFSVVTTWRAESAGQYAISVMAMRGDGTSSAPDSATINVIAPQEATATPTLTLTPTLAPTATATEEQAEEEPDSQAAQEEEPVDEVGDQEEEPEEEAPAEEDDEPAAPDEPIARFRQPTNVRSGPSTNFQPALGTFDTNDTAVIVGLNTAEDWLKIEFPGGPGGFGWVFAALADVEGEIDDLPREAGPATPQPPPPPAAPQPTAGPVPTTAPSSQVNLIIEPNSIFIDPPQPVCGQPFTVGMTIRNASSVESATGTARIQIVRVSDGQVFRTSADALVSVNLAPNGTHRVTQQFTVDVFVGESHRVEYIVDVNNTVAETNENDNRAGIQYSFGSCP